MRLTLQQLEAHLWGAANILRGKTAGQDYKNYILSLMFYKRLCDQWECETDDAIAEQEKQQGRVFTDAEKAIFRRRGEHRYAIPDGSRWGDVKAVSVNIGEALTEAMDAVANANPELRGVFTVKWNQPAPDGSGKPLIANEVVHALVQHFDEHDLSNRSVPADVLGRAYEYLIKKFADDAGAKAGEFFTPPEVVDTLVRILEPRPGDTVYDPTAGSGGMLVHAADYLREHGNLPIHARYFAQEMNWGNAAIGKINSVLHGLEADIRAGHSTITDPQFLEDGELQKFSLVLANFPFSDDYWWLKPEQQTDDKTRKARLKKEIFGKEGYKDPFGRFGRGTGFQAPPAKYGDYAFILHILASLSDAGRAGIVCPQGVLFRGQPQVEVKTADFDGKGKRKARGRKADDEYLIRRALLESGLIDAVISLPLNVFYGAGVPACLLILRKQRPVERQGRVLLIYAARHYRELSAQNELRPQDVMRMLVHYHAYGDASKAHGFVAKHSERNRREIDRRAAEEVGRLEAEYQPEVNRLAAFDAALRDASEKQRAAETERDQARAASAVTKCLGQRAKAAAKVAERDELISEAHRRAEEDRGDLRAVGEELVALYADPDELVKHARVVDMDEIKENDFNLNVPRYVDTFVPAPRMDVSDALRALSSAEERAAAAETALLKLLREVGYVVNS
ncbi:MAG: N-6 DNA methylase [Gemmatimonadetes bacterium]|nr:N-6 DNA methylase [Gemmatimonadota bacterium]